MFTFTVPITFEPLAAASITQASEVNDTARRMVVELEFETAEGTKHPRRQRLAITNGRCDGIDGQFESFELTEGMTNAFDVVMGAYVTGGKVAMLNALAALGIIPPGSDS